jgi:hypothetical protein
VIEHAPGRADDDLHAALEHLELALDRLAAVDRQHRDAALPAVAMHRFRDLYRQLASRGEDERLDVAIIRLEPFDHRQCESRGLAGPGRGAAEHVAAREKQRDGVRLDRRRLFVTE